MSSDEEEVGMDPGGEPFGVVPTPDDGSRLSDQEPWEESARPRGPSSDDARRYTPGQQAAGQHLIDVHDALRAEMTQLLDLVDRIGSGNSDPSTVRSFINRMTIRQNNWTLGLFCETYCGAITGHHSLEDRSIFPHLRKSDPELVPVLDRLGEEHDVISEILEQVDKALVALVAAEPEAIDRVRAAANLLSDAMSSHLSYEETELVEPLARLGFY